jgi:histidinol phosphatase-like PHP family hydrolase
MYTDIFGNKRYKVNLHTHTTISDGHLSPEDVTRLYHEAGYDAIALTDHWAYGKEYVTDDGLLVLSGAEYNILNVTARDGLFHIVGVGMKNEPRLDERACAQEAIDAIKATGGVAIIAHPAWSLNTPEHILALKNADATEIYNTVSGVHMSRRPDSSLIVDMLGAKGRFYPLIAADDAHYYDSDECASYIMVRADECTSAALCSAIKKGDFYASQGPEIHITRDGDEIVATTSRVSEIVFFSDAVWSRRAFTGDGITGARYKISPNDTFVRAEATDAAGRRAFTNPIILTEKND